MHDSSRVRPVLFALNELLQTIHSPDFRRHLRHEADEQMASAFIACIIGFTQAIEDSISTDGIGNPSDPDSAPDSPFAGLRRLAAEIYGVPVALLSTTGTSSLNITGVCAIAGPGEEILVVRDCHQSIILGIVQSGATPIWIVPPYDAKRGVLPITPAELDKALRQNPNARAIVITNPTYGGLFGDNAGYVQVARKHGVMIFVDQAHAPHANYVPGFPMSAERAGADLVSLSTHKVLPFCLSQGSILLVNNRELADGALRDFHRAGQTTSPSFPILLSIEAALKHLKQHGPHEWAYAVLRVASLHQICAARTPFRVIGEADVDGTRVVGVDPTRAVISTAGTGVSGHDVAGALAEAGFTAEMASPTQIVLLMPPMMDDDADRRVGQVLVSLAQRAQSVAMSQRSIPDLPVRVMTPGQAVRAPRHTVPREVAVGAVSAETIGVIPPGRALIVAGEIVSQEVLDYLVEAVSNGGHLIGASDAQLTTFQIVAGGFYAR